MRLILGQLEPDNPEHLQNGLQEANNVYATPNGYRPIPAFSAIADALPATFQGGASYVASDGTVNLLAGTATDLYLFDSGLEWDSILGSLTASRWYFTQANDHAIATHGGAPIDINLLAGTAAALAGSPPTSDYCASVRDFVVLSDGNTVTWSGFQDREEWTAGTNQSGSQSMLVGGPITGLAGGEFGLIFQRSAVTRMSYVGVPVIWQFDHISTIGCIAAGSIASAGRMHFYLSDRGFMMTDGNDVKPIGAERIDREFQESYSASDLEQLYACVDPRKHIVKWVMPGKEWAYNYQLDQWSTSEWGVRAAFGGFSQGVSLDALDPIYGDLDAMGEISLDDPRFQGGAPIMLYVNSDDEVGTQSSAPMEATFQLPYIEILPGRTARVNKIRPITDATTGVTIQVVSRRRLGEAGSTTSYFDMQTSGDIPCRVAGRYLRFRITIEAGADWTYFQGLDIPDIAAGGKR